MNKFKSRIYVAFDENEMPVGYTENKKAIKAYKKYNPYITAICIYKDEINKLKCLPLQEYITPAGKLYAIDSEQDDTIRELYKDHLTQLAQSISNVLDSILSIEFTKEELKRIKDTIYFLSHLKFLISTDSYPYMDIFDDSLIVEHYSLRFLEDMSYEKYIKEKSKELKRRNQ